jgi:hypothetical protein
MLCCCEFDGHTNKHRVRCGDCDSMPHRSMSMGQHRVKVYAHRQNRKGNSEAHHTHSHPQRKRPGKDQRNGLESQENIEHSRRGWGRQRNVCCIAAPLSKAAPTGPHLGFLCAAALATQNLFISFLTATRTAGLPTALRRCRQVVVTPTSCVHITHFPACTC